MNRNFVHLHSFANSSESGESVSFIDKSESSAFRLQHHPHPRARGRRRLGPKQGKFLSL